MKQLPTMGDLEEVKRQAEVFLDLAWDQYMDKVYEIAQDAQIASVNQFIDAKPALSFVAGMGTWSLGLRDRRDIAGSSIYHMLTDRHGGSIADERYRALFEILNMGVSGLEHNDLGSLMADYPPREKNDRQG